MKPHLEVASAGTRVFDREGVSKDGQYLRDLPGASRVIDALKEIGIDVSDAKRTQLQKETLSAFDRVVVMSEKETIPEFLSNHPGYVFWDVRDPKGTELDFHRVIRDEIQKLITDNMNLF